METGKNKDSLKSLHKRYRLTITNEDTFEEVAGFNLNRWTVYILMSFFFVLIVGITVALMAFTPLKYYIPGYGSAMETGEFEVLQRKTDSLENSLRLQEQYTEGIKKVLRGEAVIQDTMPDIGDDIEGILADTLKSKKQ